jgi:subtilisin family serine protease
MKRRIWARWIVSIVIAIILVGSLAGTASAVDLRWIAVFYPGVSVDLQLQVLAAASPPPLPPISVLHILSLINAVAIEFPAVGAEAALAALQADPLVERVDGDPPVDMRDDGQSGDGSVTPAPAPVGEVYSWGHLKIGANIVHAQDPMLAGTGIKVALIDTGVDRFHLDLKQHIIGGYNSLAGRNPDSWADDNGHGTHVAGTVAALLNNLGVIGVAPRVQIYVLKALDQSGRGRTSDVIDALQRVIKHPDSRDIRIIAGGCGTDIAWPSFEDAIRLLYEQYHKLMVFSAGNYCSGANCPTPQPTDIKFPARYRGVIAVGASDQYDRVSDFSRSGQAMAAHGVVAPGVNIFSDYLWVRGGYGYMTGTSASTPHVIGAVALAVQLQQDIS